MLRIWDLRTGECVRILEGHIGEIPCVAFLPDGQRIVSCGGGGNGDCTLRLWDIQSGECLKTLEGHTLHVACVAVARNYGLVVSGGRDKTLRVWDLAGEETPQVTERHTGDVWSVVVTPNGRRAISVAGSYVTYRGEVKVWDLESGVFSTNLEGHSQCVRVVAITPNGRMAVTGSEDNTLRVWDLDKNALRTVLGGHTWTVGRVALTPDGLHALSGSTDGTRVWYLPKGTCLHTHSGISVLAITTDGRLAISRGTDNSLEVWDLNQGQCVAMLSGHNASAMAAVVMADNRHVVSADEFSLYVWNLESRHLLHVLRCNQGINLLTAIPDGRRVVSVGKDGIIRVWDVNNGEGRKLPGNSHGKVDVLVAFSDGKHVLSGDDDGWLCIWDIDNGTLQGCFLCNSWIRACGVSPDGTRIIAGVGAGNVYLLQLENVKFRPVILTAWCAPLDGSCAMGCPVCCNWSVVPESVIGAELLCPSCGIEIKLNPFTISAPWRVVALAWQAKF